MKQYCRYCVHLCAGNGVYCEAKKITIRESAAKSVNHCDTFDFCEIDAFGETSGYKPRSSRSESPRRAEGEQIAMEVE